MSEKLPESKGKKDGILGLLSDIGKYGIAGILRRRAKLANAVKEAPGATEETLDAPEPGEQLPLGLEPETQPLPLADDTGVGSEDEPSEVIQNITESQIPVVMPTGLLAIKSSLMNMLDDSEPGRIPQVSEDGDSGVTKYIDELRDSKASEFLGAIEQVLNIGREKSLETICQKADSIVMLFKGIVIISVDSWKQTCASSPDSKILQQWNTMTPCQIVLEMVQEIENYIEKGDNPPERLWSELQLLACLLHEEWWQGSLF